MTAEELIRLYNVGAFARSVCNSPSHSVLQVTIGGEEQLMKLSELEEILRANKDRLRIVLANQAPVVVQKVAQPWAS